MGDFQSSFQNVVKSPWVFWFSCFYFLIRTKPRAQKPVCDCTGKTEELIPVMWGDGAKILVRCGRRIKKFFLKFWGIKAHLGFVEVHQKWLLSQAGICLSPAIDEDVLKKVQHAHGAWKLLSISFHLQRSVVCWKSMACRALGTSRDFHLHQLRSENQYNHERLDFPHPYKSNFIFFHLVTTVPGLQKPGAGIFDQKSSGGAYCRCKHR